MPIQYGATTNAATKDTGTLTWTHVPNGSNVDGVIIAIVQDVAVTDEISSVTYGGVTVPKYQSVTATTGETAQVDLYFLDNGLPPSGNQTVTIHVSGSDQKMAWCTTLYSDAGKTLTVRNTGTIDSTSLANPSAVLNLHANTSYVGMVFHSGINQNNGIAPLSGWTGHEIDFNNSTGAFYSYNTIASANVTYGWSRRARNCVCGNRKRTVAESIVICVTVCQPVQFC